MPILPEYRQFYDTPAWRALSTRIRYGRARGRCECDGRCGHRWAHRDTGGRCPALDKHEHPLTGSVVHLSTAHLNQVPGDDRPENLRAMCQKCHVSYDAGQHAATRVRTAAEAVAATMTPLFEETP